MKKDLIEIAKDKILVLDGGMGTMIQRYNLTEEDFSGERFKDNSVPLKGNNDILALTRPDVLAEIHAAYLEAGADIIETNTFNGTSVAQADYKMEAVVYELNKTAAVIARKVADEYTEKEPDKPRFVAGSIGPTNKTASMSPDVNRPGFRAIDYDELVKAYKEQVNGLLDGGVDILLIETIFDTLNAKAALYAVQEIFEERNILLPIMMSGTVTDASGRLLSGQTPEAFVTSVGHAPLFSVGLNCALGAKDMLPYLQDMSKNTNFHMSAHPNAGLPNEFGAYDENPEDMSNQIKDFFELGVVNVIGGCCGTTPEHIKAFADMASKYKPRELSK